MKYVVTGGAGFIGSHITKKLVERGDVVTVIDNMNTGKEKNLESVIDKISFVKGDVLDTELLESITKDVDGVFHQAALASVQDSFDEPDEYHNVNVNGTENILKLSKKYGFKVVYASSSSVYGNPIRIPIKESDEKNPINPYAETKLKKEGLAIEYSKMGVSVIGLRYFNVFGKGQSKEYAGVLKLFLERIRDKLPPKINGDGMQFRDFVHVNDVVNANLMSMDSDITHEFFNVGTNTTITIIDLAKTIIGYSGLNIEPIFGPALDGDVHQTKANIDLIKKKIGWEPSIMLVDWIKNIVSSKKFNEI
ncbi:NAD-dependent epimerase/dehydratase family protein [Marine Group I thaumarchaeote]|uniref:NAD-dependent epimerase/dehydratase family protein n=1 Tax=Marine Group I thaumarchaeote TaxID=2511932 RepID=A0A7K4NTP2_9ARCH|nr:NAD-dependent epimerase/dehydratase family protein [Marine Group I thaumarchaeote]